MLLRGKALRETGNKADTNGSLIKKNTPFVSLDLGKLETRRLVYGVYRCILRSITMVGKLLVRVTEGVTRL